MARLAPDALLIAPIKPQFDLEVTAIDKGGILKSEASRQVLVERVTHWLNGMPGWRARDVTRSPITGKGGNLEYLIGATHDG